MSEEGYFSLEFDELKVNLNKEIPQTSTCRLDIVIDNSQSVYHWLPSGSNTFNSSKFTPFLQTNEANETSETPQFPYLFGFNNQYLRSNYLDLNNDVVNGLANVLLLVKLIIINEAPPPPTNTKPVKGQPPPPVIPAEEVLFELAIPVADILVAKNAKVSVTKDIIEGNIAVRTCHSTVNIDQCRFTYNLNGDNCLAEYVIGSKIIKWKSAILQHPETTWALHAPDVLDPKAKVQPTAQDLRNKYIDNITKNVEAQAKFASYQLIIGSENNGTALATSDDNVEGEVTADQDAAKKILQFFPMLSLSSGKIAFDKDLALTVPLDEDIRARCNLWKVTWEQSPNIFLHRNKARQLAQLISSDPNHAYIPLTVKKTPMPEAVAVEGGEVFATSIIDLSSLVTPGQTSQTISPKLDGNDIAADTSLSVLLMVSAPLVEVSAFNSIPDKLEQTNNADAIENSKQSADSTSNNKNGVVSKNSINRDALQELRDEICRCIESIAQEYVSQYPDVGASTNSNLPTSRASSPQMISKSPREDLMNGLVSENSIASTNNPLGNVVDPYQAKMERQGHFLQYLTSCGAFHDLQEKLRPAVMLIIRDRYGPRGRALGKSAYMRGVDTHSHGHEEEKEVNFNDDAQLQGILSELYTFLIQECNIVLNSMFASTLMQRTKEEIENPAKVNDEVETPKQVYDRLFRQAQDAIADSRFDAAEKLHMERLQLVDHEVSLGSNITFVHQAYIQYAHFALKNCAHLLTTYVSNQTTNQANNLDQSNNSESSTATPEDEAIFEKCRQCQRRAREALAAAVKLVPQDWETKLLYAAVLLEASQPELAEDMLRNILALQLTGSVDNIDDYNTDFSDVRKNAYKTGFQLRSFDDDFSGYESDRLVNNSVHPKVYAVLATMFHMQKKSLLCRKALRLANRCFEEGSYLPPLSEHGSPRRTLVIVLCQTSLELAPLALHRVAQNALRLASDCDSAATLKAQARNKPAISPPHVRYLLKRAQTECSWGLGSDLDAILGFNTARDIPLVCDNPRDTIAGHLAHAKSCAIFSAYSSVKEMEEAYFRAIQLAREKLTLEEVSKEQILPLEAFVKLGDSLLSSSRIKECIFVCLYGAQIYSSSTLCFMLGWSYMQQEAWKDAEEALIQANLLDNRNAEIWAGLSLLCVNLGAHRLLEAEESLFQALRLGLNRAIYLKTLATAFMGVDKLQIAEDLLRRSMVIEQRTSKKKSANTYTRKLLADVLAAQNHAAKAVEEYKGLLFEDDIEFSNDKNDIVERINAAEKCKDLLVSLGRDDELEYIKNIIAALNNRLELLESKY